MSIFVLKKKIFTIFNLKKIKTMESAQLGGKHFYRFVYDCR